MTDVMDYKYIDDASKFIIMSLKIVSSNRSVFLSHILHSLMMIINAYYHSEQASFNQRPFFRLILNIIEQLSREPQLDDNIVLTTFVGLSTFLHKLDPNEYPAFSFAWVELISNKSFMPAILEKYEYWDLYHILLLDAFRFVKNKITLEALANN